MPNWGDELASTQLPLPLSSFQRPTMKKMTTAVQRGMILSAAIYVAVGACGYSAFGSR